MPSLSASDLDILLDIVATHLVRHDTGQELAQGWHRADVEEVFSLLSKELTERNATADAVGEGEQPELPFDGTRVVIDPFDFVGLDPCRVSNYDSMGDE